MSETIGSAGFKPENDLEIELVRATHEPGLQPGFLRELLDHEVYLALLMADGSRIEAGPGGQAIIPPGAKLEVGPVDRNGEPALPFFSAPSRARACYRRDHLIAPDKARAIFARHAGARFVLNPGSDYSVDFDAEEAAALVRGEVTAH